jgi:Tfp pilus assembly protein PilF
VTWAFTQFYAENWHPLSWMSHMLDIDIFGLDPSGPHLINLLFHIANTLLLFGVLLKMTGALWQSGLVAVLFALHPLNVESVAWISERKTVLSTFFGFLTIWAYVDYVKNKKTATYLLVVLFLALSLLAKALLVTLPCVLLLLDFWPLKRWGWQETATGKVVATGTFKNGVRLILEKIPLFLLVVGASGATFMAQNNSGNMPSTEDYSLYSRLSNTLVSYLEYLEKMVWPQGLAIYYPHPGNTLPVWKTLLSAVVLVGITVWVVRAIRRAPYLAVGWFWYLGTLVPMIGIVQIGDQALADRYVYIPLIGIFIALSWGLSDLFAESRYKKMASILFAGMLIPLMIVTWNQVGHWRNGVTLFGHAVSGVENTAPGYAINHNSLGYALEMRGRHEEAITHYRHAVKINPDYSQAHNNLGVALIGMKNLDEAIEHFKRAVTIKSNYAEAYNNLANALADTGKLNESIPNYKKAIRLKADYVDPHINLGITMAQQGRFEESVKHFEGALTIDPNNIKARNFLRRARSHAAKRS